MSDIQNPELCDSALKFGAKLLDVLKHGIGTSPLAIKRKARAKAEEISLIANAIRENSDFPITYNNGEIHIDGSSYKEITARMNHRVHYQELKKQMNIENVISEAYSQIEPEERVSNKKVDEDWITRFFSYAGDVSNEEMQILWGAILAGEVKRPGSFSLRSLEALKTISREEAELFYRISSLTLRDNYLFFFNDREWLNKFNIDFLDILKLQDVGIISTEGFFYALECSATPIFCAYYDDYTLYIHNRNVGKEISLAKYKLSSIGEELFSIIPDKKYDLTYIKYLSDILKVNNVVIKYKEGINSTSDITELKDL